MAGGEEQQRHQPHLAVAGAAGVLGGGGEGGEDRIQARGGVLDDPAAHRRGGARGHRPGERPQLVASGLVAGAVGDEHHRRAGGHVGRVAGGAIPASSWASTSVATARSRRSRSGSAPSQSPRAAASSSRSAIPFSAQGLLRRTNS